MSEPVWLDLPVALAIHALLIDEHGGAPGLRDQGLLESALARPRQLIAYGEPDLFALAAAYTAGIVRNHPFADGNKRTGFVIGILFLELNGQAFRASEPEVARAVVDLAAGTIDEDTFALWLRDSCG